MSGEKIVEVPSTATKTALLEVLGSQSVNGEEGYAEDAITSLTAVYLNTKNVKLATKCRQMIDALLREYGPEKQSNSGA